jgi:DNA-binding response OmpR family regulator
MTRGLHRILVVDDDQDTCRNLADILVDAGYSVTTAGDAANALASVRDAPFDLVLLDLKIPGTDGLTLFNQIKQISPGTPAVIITAYASSATTGAALAAGALTVLTKPVDVRALLSLVTATVSRPLVLVVDDDADLCANLLDLFRAEGFRAAVARACQEAARALGLREHPVVLIDMKLPSGSGAEVFELVRRHNANASTIVITGYRTELEQRVEELLAMGANAVLYKPLDVGLLLAKIRELVGQRPQR